MFDLVAILRGSRYMSLRDEIMGMPEFDRDEPITLWLDNKKQTRLDGWRSALERTRTDSWVRWEDEGDESRRIGVAPRFDLVEVTLPHSFADVSDGIGKVEPLPFETCSLGTSFWLAWKRSEYRAWGLGPLGAHGWACGFRGAGHDRLVSRRWLDFGPWRVIRRPNDTTFIQFYDLAITDPTAAYEQAKVGHQRMGIDPMGGYIGGIDPEVLEEVRGVYRADVRTLDIVIAPGIEISQQDLRVACALRMHHRDTKPSFEPVDHIAYVFIDKADAQRYLHELWLRELECWYVDERGKHRLDTDYHPVPDPPAWVKALESGNRDELPVL